MKYQIITIALTVLMISGCSSSGEIESLDPKQIASEMQDEGFQEGEIVFSDVEGDCAYTIITNGMEPETLDPVNLDEEYQIDGKKIWFKFTSLRMQNRCEKARPIDIVEIRLRED